MGTLRLGGDPIALAPATVRCAECARVLYEDEAQAVRWSRLSAGLDELYPCCEECARRELAPDMPRSHERA